MDLLKKLSQNRIKSIFSCIWQKFPFLQKIIGFSLGEIMVIMLIVSIVMAALSPIISKQLTPDMSAAIKPGTIIMWSITNAVPSSREWHLCDGGTYNGFKTPDLRNKFIYGWKTGDTPGTKCDPSTTPACYENDNASVNGQDITTGITNGYKLTTDMLPAHSHYAYSTFGAGMTDSESVSHTHKYNYANATSSTFTRQDAAPTQTFFTSNGSYTDVETNTHTHTINPISDNTNPPAEGRNNIYKNMPQYYVAAFYMKIK